MHQQIIAQQQGMKRWGHLSQIRLNQEAIKALDWPSALVEPKQCFNNAFLLAKFSDRADIELVLGYVFFEDIGIAIEHAWNVNSLTSEHIDMTAQQHWQSDSLGDASYYVLKVFSQEELEAFPNQAPDFMYLRRNQRELFL